VRYLAASPETMISPGVPTGVADDIARNSADPQTMANAVVSDAMREGTAAAFDVLDLDPAKLTSAEKAIKTFNDASASLDADGKRALRGDVRSIEGMVRFSEATPDMPWHADRPAIALYAKIASDDALPQTLRTDARNAAGAVRALVLAHKESRGYDPFDGSSYRDAAGPTVHAPVNAKQIDPWSPQVSETHNAFYDAVDQAKFVRVIA